MATVSLNYKWLVCLEEHPCVLTSRTASNEDSMKISMKEVVMSFIQFKEPTLESDFGIPLWLVYNLFIKELKTYFLHSASASLSAKEW